MVTVHYWTTRGTPDARPIYGVNPQGMEIRGGLPAGVASLDVSSTPPGCERTHVVDTTASPVVVPDPGLEAKIDRDADAALGAKAFKALVLACSNQTLGGIAWSAAGYTPAQLRDRARAAWRTL